MPPQTKPPVGSPFIPRRCGPRTFRSGRWALPKAAGQVLASAPAPPGARAPGPQSVLPPACARQAAGSRQLHKGPFVRRRPPAPAWLPDRRRSRVAALRLGLRGARGAGRPGKQILRCPVSCNVSRVRRGGGSGPSQGQGLGGAGGQPPPADSAFGPAASRPLRAGLSGGQLRRGGR